MHTGWITGVAGRPAFPARMVLTASFVLSSGSVALLPPSPCGGLMRARSGRCITARLGARTPGVGTTRLLRPRTSSLGIRGVACARPRSHAKTLSAPCRCAKAIAHGCPPCKVHRARRRRVHRTQPAVRDDRDPPLVTGQGGQCVRQIRISVKWNILRGEA